MAYDPRHLKEAQRKLDLAREEHRAAQQAHQSACWARYPRLWELDRAIRATVSKAIVAALQRGGDPSQAVEAARRENLALQEQRAALLQEAGIDPQSLEETPYCPLCGDTGRRKGGFCSCVTSRCAQENLAELAGQLDLPHLDFESFSLEWYSPRYDAAMGASERELMETVRDTCADYAKSFPQGAERNLFLYGGTGLGKTLLSGCMAKTVAQKGFWTVYVTAGELFRQYEAVKFNREGAEEAREDLRRFEGCDLLVLDDLGSEMNSPLVQAALYELLNGRILGGKHTVISSNLSMDDVRRRYTPQVASRLEGEYTELAFVGRDVRLQKKEREQA